MHKRLEVERRAKKLNDARNKGHVFIRFFKNLEYLRLVGKFVDQLVVSVPYTRAGHRGADNETTYLSAANACVIMWSWSGASVTR